MDECSFSEFLCQHECANQPGSYYCFCPPGYVLLDDTRSCQGKNTFLKPDVIFREQAGHFYWRGGEIMKQNVFCNVKSKQGILFCIVRHNTAETLVQYRWAQTHTRGVITINGIPGLTKYGERLHNRSHVVPLFYSHCEEKWQSSQWPS